MKVRELIERLSAFDPEANAVGIWDTMPDWEITGVFLWRGSVIIDVDKEHRWSAADLDEMYPQKPSPQGDGAGE